MEIIPQQNPYNLKPGDTLEIKVLLNGKAARFCWVHATYAGFSNVDDFAFATKTDAKGMAKVRLLRYGNWLIVPLGGLALLLTVISGTYDWFYRCMSH